MKRLLLAIFIVAACGNTFSQTWQPMGIPEGSGVTDMVYWKGSAPFDDKLWVTTGSVDWPNGQRGGVFYSATTSQGPWYRLGGSAGYYVGRTLEVGQDGNLYASLWRDPAIFPADALCRLSVQAATFGVLYQAQAGDNIFSIAVKNTPHTIFAGTRNGVIRSTDNGTTFGYSNTGIPDSAWVYDIAIDSTGILAIASSKGVFISSDNGENWMTTTGISPEDTAKVLLFINDTTTTEYSIRNGSAEENSSLWVGTVDGVVFKSFLINLYLTFINIEYIFGEEIAKLLVSTYLDRLFGGVISQGSLIENYSTKIQNTGGVYESIDNGVTWKQINDGLPPEPPVSALALKEVNETSAQLYAGLFNDTTNGAGIYKLAVTVDVEEVGDQIPSDYMLEQNYPNPFNPSTTIQFALPKESFTRLEIFNSLGEKVSTLVSETLSPGTYKYEWKAKELSSGIYFYRLSTENFVQTKKLLLMK